MAEAPVVAGQAKPAVSQDVKTVSAKTKDKPTPVTVNYSIPGTLDGLTKAFGAEVTAAAAQDSITISVQAFMRRMINKGTSPADIQKAVSTWRPDVRSVVKQSAFEKAASSLDKLTPEERRALLAKLQALK